MSDCCNYFQFTDPGDSFASWEGLRGPKGDPGPQGEPGQGLVIQGIVATVGDLPAAANQGDVYLVGASDPYEGYLWTDGAWEDIGELAMGPQGPAGTITVGTVTGLPAGSTPTVTNSGTAEAAVLNFGIPAGADGQDGQDGAPGPGVSSGGTTGQMLTKKSNTDYDTEWTNQPTIPSAYTSTPEMDGTASAGSSSAWARGDHVHPHDSMIVRENLLDNWYFVGGGTGTYGVFPVNQRGQASYSTANAFTIDRWKLTSGSLTVVSGGITLNGTIVQTLPTAIGQTFIASALLSDGTMISPTYNDSTKTFTLTAAGETIVAVKLEAGSVQTLAHLESGIWVLNEVPHFVEQLLQCQTNDPFYNSKGLTSPVGTIQDGGYYRLGKLVVLSVRISLTQSLSDNTVVLEGCPLPLASSYNFVVVSTNYPNFENNFLNSTGQIRLKGSLSSGLILMLYTSYIGQ